MSLSLSEGRVDQAEWIPSPNFNQRPLPSDISLLVIHNISLPPNQFGGGYIADFFQNRLDPQAHPYFQTISQLQVSSHFLIQRDGTLIQFVDCQNRAWHAGVSAFEGKANCNDFSIGVELEGADTTPYTDEQYAQLVALTCLLRGAFPNIKNNIVGHCDIAPGRKTDPGPAFDWSRYRVALQQAQSKENCA